MRKNIDSLQLKNLSHFYKLEDLVFDQVNFDFPKNQVLYLKGPRGSGKGTLMKILIGLQAPTSGEFLINNQPVNHLSHDEFNQFRLNMGFSFDVGGLINNLTLYENFKLMLDYHNFIEPEKRFDYIVNMMKAFHLDEHKHLRPALISSSARKATAVLRAFILQPELIVLNDPTQGLAPEHIEPLIKLIHYHQENLNLKFIIISSDDSSLINKCAGTSINVTTTELQMGHQQQIFKGVA
jgi:phospholipid/cholesterol/gamma-HCH transport system ATP-binding protein